MKVEMRNAISATDASILVTASAGSGKTYTIIEKVAHLIATGEDPGLIKVITYTNAAADEMRSRLATKLGAVRLAGLFIGTLNSFALKSLREEVFNDAFALLNRRGWLSSEPSLWRLIEDDQVDNIIKDIRDSLNKRVTLKSLRLGLGADLTELTKLNDKTRLARQEMRRTNSITQDDLVEMLADGVSAITGGIKHLVVDEAQDLPHSHRRFILNAIDEGVLTFICQDDAQAIFGFLGKRQEHMGFSPAPELTGVRYHLSSNFRSGRKIVELANKVRARLAADSACSLVVQEAERGTDGKVVEIEFEMLCDHQYKESVPSNIMTDIAFEFACAESCALLCRTWADVALFREFLISNNLCDQIDATLSLRLPHNRALLGVAQVIASGTMSSSDLEAISSYLALAPAGSMLARTGNVASLAIAAHKQDYDKTLAEIVDDFIGESVWSTLRTGTTLSVLTDVWTDFGGGYSPLLAKAVEETEDINDLLSSANRLSKTSMGLKKVVTTVHQAKGLEYDTVIIYGISEGIYPSRRDKTQEQINEAGRTLYTAITRARDRLILLRPTIMRSKPRERSFWLN